MVKFSVLIPVFYRANPIFLKEALSSVLENQSCKPAEVIIVVDGTPKKLIKETLELYEKKYFNQVKIKILPKHKGTGYALKVGVEHCSYELIARMDADDVSLYDRFEKQIEFMNNNPKIDVLGGIVEEFNQEIGDLKQYRIVPESHRNIANLAKFRCPVNHPTVMFKRSKVLTSGNYSNDFSILEDYALWIKMLHNKAKFHNLQETLLYFRFGNGKAIVAKRSGLDFVGAFLKLTKYAYDLGFYTKMEYYFYSFFRAIFHATFPLRFYLWVYKKITRKKHL